MLTHPKHRNYSIVSSNVMIFWRSEEDPQEKVCVAILVVWCIFFISNLGYKLPKLNSLSKPEPDYMAKAYETSPVYLNCCCFLYCPFNTIMKCIHYSLFLHHNQLTFIYFNNMPFAHQIWFGNELPRWWLGKPLRWKPW